MVDNPAEAGIGVLGHADNWNSHKRHFSAKLNPTHPGPMLTEWAKGYQESPALALVLAIWTQGWTRKPGVEAALLLYVCVEGGEQSIIASSQ